MPTPQVVEMLKTPDAITNASTLTTSVSTAVGDTLIVVYGSDYYALETMPDPTSTAGTLILQGTMDAGNNATHAKVYTVAIEASGAHDVVIPAHINCDIFGVVLRVNALLTLDDVATLVNLSNSTAHVAPSVATTGADRLLLCVWMSKSPGSYSGDAYVLPGVMVDRGQPKASPYSSFVVGTEEIALQGETGTRTATLFTAGMSAALTIAFAGPDEEPPDPEEPEEAPGIEGPVTLGSDFGWTYGFIAPITNTNGVIGDAIVDVTENPTQATINNNFRVLSDKVNRILVVLRNSGEIS